MTSVGTCPCLAPASGGAAGSGLLPGRAVVAAADHALAAVDLALEAAGGVPAGLFGEGDVDVDVAEAAGGGALAGKLVGGVAALDVARDEEADKEVGEGREVDDVEPDGKRLAGADDAGLRDVRHVLVDDGLDAAGVGAGAKEEGADRRHGGGGVGGRGGGGGRGKVVNKGVAHGQGSADEELGDLHAGQAALDEDGDADVERRHGVVGVLTC